MCRKGLKGGRGARLRGWIVIALMAALAGSAPRAGAEGGAPGTGAETGLPRTGAEGGGLETWRQFKRQVLFSDVLLAPAAEFPTGAARVASLRRMHRTEIDGPSGFWRIQCVAFTLASP